MPQGDRIESAFILSFLPGEGLFLFVPYILRKDQDLRMISLHYFRVGTAVLTKVGSEGEAVVCVR